MSNNCVVCRSTSPSPSSSRPLWLMGCKKPWIWAWPQLWASATTTPHSLSKYTAFWIRKAFLLPQIRYPPLLHYRESAAAVVVVAAALLYCSADVAEKCSCQPCSSCFCHHPACTNQALKKMPSVALLLLPVHCYMLLPAGCLAALVY